MEVRSMLTGILSRRNTASHRYYTQLRALPLSLPHFVDFVRFLLSQSEKKQETPSPVPPVKNRCI